MNKILIENAGPVNAGPDNDPPVATEIADKLRTLRQMHGMSQRELARVAGMTNGAISMIEKNRVSPTVASLKKILDAFGLSLAEFFATRFEPDSKIFYRATEMTPIATGPLVLRQIGADQSHRKLQVLHETYAPGGDTGPAMLMHDGEEAGVVVRGQIEITVGGRCETLKAGDGYYFSSRMPHRFRNASTEVCEIVSSCTPPTF